MKIAVLGPEGTFSDKAYLEYKKDYKQEDLEPVYCATIEEVFRAVSSGKEQREETVCDLGIVPIENTLDGYVQRTLDLLLEKDVYVFDEKMVPVQFSLVGNVTDVSQIKKLYVQFKASGQCRRFIGILKGVEIITTESNMDSYYKIADEIGSAAIVPSHIAEAETRRLVIDDVTDTAQNHTRFVVFRPGEIDTGNRHIKKLVNEVLWNQSREEVLSSKMKLRIPIYIIPAIDRPGILFDILRRFYDNQINLVSLMSRPTKHELGTYNFYVEVNALYEQLDTVLDALRQIQVYNDVKMLGFYAE